MILTKLDKNQTKKCADKLLKNVKKKRGTFNPRSISWSGLNAYITNVEESILTTEEILNLLIKTSDYPIKLAI